MQIYQQWCQLLASYSPPLRKTIHDNSSNIRINEMDVFKMLDKLKTSSSGLDDIPSWFFRLAAPSWLLLLHILYNLSLNSSKVPTQWKSSVITPVEKVKNPKTAAEYRPISVTSILSRLLEKFVVNKYLYPALINPPVELTFSDQFAFRPTGSITAALIVVIEKITELLRSGTYVVLISLDFSRAFDMVRHGPLFNKLFRLDIEDVIYNWLISYFEDREHVTRFLGEISNKRTINASVVQGSVVGPYSYSVAGSDLRPTKPCFDMVKFADDVDLITALDNYDLISDELEHNSQRAMMNNLVLNKSKTKEIIFHNVRSHPLLPPPIDGIIRVDNIKILGVTLQDNLSMNNHVDSLLVDCSNMLFAMKILRSHGMGDEGLHEVFRSKIISKITYAASAWWGLASETVIDRINYRQPCVATQPIMFCYGLFYLLSAALRSNAADYVLPLFIYFFLFFIQLSFSETTGPILTKFSEIVYSSVVWIIR